MLNSNVKGWMCQSQLRKLRPGAGPSLGLLSQQWSTGFEYVRAYQPFDGGLPSGFSQQRTLLVLHGHLSECIALC